MSRFSQEVAIAEKLEGMRLWRRAARQWLVVLDITPVKEERLRDMLTMRRAKCITQGNCFCNDYSGISEARLVDDSDLGVAA